MDRTVQKMARRLSKGWDRRDFLTASTALAAGAWAQNGVRAAMSDARHQTKRLVCVGLDLSLRPENFFPAAPGATYEMTPLLKPVANWRGQMSVFSQLDHPGVNGGHNAIQAYLSGVRHEQAAGAPQGILTLDQFAAGKIGQATRFPSLCLGIGGGDSISWTQAGIAVPKIWRPSEAFDLLFRPQPAAGIDAKRHSIATDRTVADLLLADAKRLRPTLDQWDREKLDEFQTAVHDFEAGLKRSEVWLDKPYPRTDAKAPKAAGDGSFDDIRSMFDVIALALHCDATRVVSFNIGYGLAVANKLPGVSQNYHDLSHTGQEPDKLEQLRRIESRLMAELDHFLGKLAAVQDGAGRSLLDSTVVLFGSGMGNASSHSNRNLPVLVAGGRLQHGRHLFFEKQGRKQTPLCNLYVTLLQHLGLEIDRFGTSDGNLNELLA